MLSNLSEFRVALERYEDEPASCSRLLRGSSQADPAQFLVWAQVAFLERPTSRVMKLIAGIAASVGLIPVLLQLHLRDRVQAIAIAKKVLESEPRFDLTLVELIVRPENGFVPDDSSVFGILDILDAISEGDKLVPSVLKILKHESPKIRSKAATFVGSRTQNLAWAASRTTEFDGRVRANILESLHNGTADGALDLFRSHVYDENNRAAGNAVLGMYMLGAAEAIPLAIEMATHEDSRFRNTATWLLGKTADPRFLPNIAELMKDPEPLVRSQAFKALGVIKKAEKARQASLHVKAIFNPEGTGESVLALVLDARHEPLQGIPATGFLLRDEETGKPITNFKVLEQESKGQLSVAFIGCFEAGEETEESGNFLAAMERCLPLRRPNDRWSVTKLKSTSLRPEYAPARWAARPALSIVPASSGTGSRTATGDALWVEFSTQAARLEQFVHSEAQIVYSDEQIAPFARSLTKGDVTFTAPNIILFGKNKGMKDLLEQELSPVCPSLVSIPEGLGPEETASLAYQQILLKLHWYEIQTKGAYPVNLSVRHGNVCGNSDIFRYLTHTLERSAASIEVPV